MLAVTALQRIFVLLMEVTAEHTDYKVLYEEQQLITIQLRHELEQLKKMIFAARSERFLPADASSSHQLSLGLTAEQQQTAPAGQSQKISYTRIINDPASIPVNHPVRMALPAHLERKEIILEPEQTEGLRKIGDEVTEELEYRPGK